MPRILRIALPILACAALIAGCGSSVPPDGVAKIGDTVITKAQFNHWLNAAAHGSPPPGLAVHGPRPAKLREVRREPVEAAGPEGREEADRRPAEDPVSAAVQR